MHIPRQLSPNTETDTCSKTCPTFKCSRPPSYVFQGRGRSRDSPTPKHQTIAQGPRSLLRMCRLKACLPGPLASYSCKAPSSGWNTGHAFENYSSGLMPYLCTSVRGKIPVVFEIFLKKRDFNGSFSNPNMMCHSLGSYESSRKQGTLD